MYLQEAGGYTYIRRLFCAVWYSSATSNLYSHVTHLSLIAFTFNTILYRGIIAGFQHKHPAQTSLLEDSGLAMRDYTGLTYVVVGLYCLRYIAFSKYPANHDLKASEYVETLLQFGG